MTPRRAIQELLAERGAGKTICPSEAARRLAGDTGDWRGWMGEIHAAATGMASAGEIATTWRGAPRTPGEGPYRIGTGKTGANR